MAFCEIDPFCRKVLAKHWPDVPIYEDITKVKFERGQADIITGGFPCQDISYAGDGTGIAGKRSGLYRELVRAIRVVRPKYAIVENVAALLNRGMGILLGDLAEIGNDAEWDCIPASDCGAPHGRPRVWIVAHPPSLRLSGSGRYIKPISPAPDAYREASGIVDAFQRGDVPFLCGRHDGLPKQLLRQINMALGNTIDSAFGCCIGRAILEAER